MGVEDLLLQALDQLVEALLRLLAGELVVHQLLERAGGALGQGVEEALPHPGVVALPAGQLLPLPGQDLVQLLPHLGERPVEVEVAHLPPAPGLQAAAEVVQAAEAPRDAAPHEAPEGGLGAPARQDVVRDLVQELADVQVGPERVLAAVPLLVPRLHRGALLGSSGPQILRSRTSRRPGPTCAW